MEETIETARLRLRPIEPRDAARVAEFIGDYEVCKWLATVPYPYTEEDARAWIALNRGLTARGEIIDRVIEIEGRACGAIGLSQVKTIEGGRVAEFGYWLAKPYWGKGLITEAARAFLEYTFGDLGFAGLKSGYFTGNHRSAHVLAKLGFRTVGEGRKYCLARRAEIPHVALVMTRAQWLEAAGRRAA